MIAVSKDPAVSREAETRRFAGAATVVEGQSRRSVGAAVERFVVDHPFSVLAVSLAMGVLVGWLLKRR